jgi:hypothetical protein
VPFDPPSPQPSPAEQWYLERERRRQQAAAQEQARWWASLTDAQREQVNREREAARQREAEERERRERADEQAQRAAEAASRAAEAARRAAEAYIERATRALTEAGAPGALDFRDWHQKGTPFPRRFGRGWVVGTYVVHTSAGNGAYGNQEGSSTTMDVAVTVEGNWVLLPPPDHVGTVFVRNRRYGERAEGSLDGLRQHLPEYADGLRRLAEEHGVTVSPT